MMERDPLKEIPATERKKLSDLMKTLKFTKKSDLQQFAEHTEVEMFVEFLEKHEQTLLQDFGRYLRLLQKEGDTYQCELFVEYYAASRAT